MHCAVSVSVHAHGGYADAHVTGLQPLLLACSLLMAVDCWAANLRVLTVLAAFSLLRAQRTPAWQLAPKSGNPASSPLMTPHAA